MAGHHVAACDCFARAATSALLLPLIAAVEQPREGGPLDPSRGMKWVVWAGEGTKNAGARRVRRGTCPHQNVPPVSMNESADFMHSRQISCALPLPHAVCWLRTPTLPTYTPPLTLAPPLVL